MNRAALHSQLASVMEMLANAAVVEICKLVDEGFALLRSEVSRAQTENRALRRRIQMLEPRSGGREAIGSADTDGPCSDDRRPFPIQAQRKRDLDAEDAGNFAPLPGTVDESAACESLPIKEERLEDDLDPGRGQNAELQPSADGATSAKSSPGGGESRHSTLEVSALETALKMEVEKSSVDSRLQNEALTHGPYSEHSAAPPGCKQLHGFFAQGVSGTEGDDLSCSYAAEMESESLSFHSELPSIPTAEDDEGNRTPLGSPKVKQELVPVDTVDTVSGEAETEMPCLWNHNAVSSRASFPLHRQGRGDGQRDRKQQGSLFDAQSERATEIKCNPSAATGFVPCDGSLIPSNDMAAHSRATRREKLFICTICGKAFNRPKKVEIHLRVHTGEKPFRCTLCGKWFAESGNLKKHQRVHTGEKPFSCAQCGRRFAWIRNLKTHQLRSHT